MNTIVAESNNGFTSSLPNIMVTSPANRGQIRYIVSNENNDGDVY